VSIATKVIELDLYLCQGVLDIT